MRNREFVAVYSKNWDSSGSKVKQITDNEIATGQYQKKYKDAIQTYLKDYFYKYFWDKKYNSANNRFKLKYHDKLSDDFYYKLNPNTNNRK